MAKMKCIVCGGAIVQDKILIDTNVVTYTTRYDGCHCTGCGIKFKPNLDELSKLSEDRIAKAKD